MVKKSDTTIRVRFAPSPTGHLHIGGVRTALFNWLYARHTGGTYVVRIEDTDLERSTQEYLDSQLASLEWLGLTSHEPLVFQMSRNDDHNASVNQLLESKKAYRCYCLPRDVEAVLDAHEHGIGSKYDGTCRDKEVTDELRAQPHAIRFALPSTKKTIVFNDLIRGTVSVESDQLDDFVIVRRDGTPTYNFCVVVDDIFMKISHVIRGEDHISNTIKQLLLYEALEEQPPFFGHLPLILGKSGNKLSKRDAAVSVEHYREQGYCADALKNYLVRLGWSHKDQELFTTQEMIQLFSLGGVGKKGSIFDPAKLEWMNGMYIRAMSAEKLLEAIHQMEHTAQKKLLAAWDHDRLMVLLDLYKQRTTTLRNLLDSIEHLAHNPASLDLSLIDAWRNDKTKSLLEDYNHELAYLQSFDRETIFGLAQQASKQAGEKLVHLAQVLRLALTGTIDGPGVFDLLVVLGKEESEARINRLLDLL